MTIRYRYWAERIYSANYHCVGAEPPTGGLFGAARHDPGFWQLSHMIAGWGGQ